MQARCNALETDLEHLTLLRSTALSYSVCVSMYALQRPSHPGVQQSVVGSSIGNFQWHDRHTVPIHLGWTGFESRHLHNLRFLQDCTVEVLVRGWAADITVCLKLTTLLPVTEPAANAFGL